MQNLRVEDEEEDDEELHQRNLTIDLVKTLQPEERTTLLPRKESIYCRNFNVMGDKKYH